MTDSINKNTFYKEVTEDESYYFEPSEKGVKVQIECKIDNSIAECIIGIAPESNTEMLERQIDKFESSLDILKEELEDEKDIEESLITSSIKLDEDCSIKLSMRVGGRVVDITLNGTTISLNEEEFKEFRDKFIECAEIAKGLYGRDKIRVEEQMTYKVEKSEETWTDIKHDITDEKSNKLNKGLLIEILFGLLIVAGFLFYIINN